MSKHIQKLGPNESYILYGAKTIKLLENCL